MPGIITFAPAQIGELYVYALANPGAGNDFSLIIQSSNFGYLVRPVSIRFKLVTSATAGTRYAHVCGSDASTILYRCFETTGIGASATTYLYFNPNWGRDSVNNGGHYISTLWDGWIPPAGQIFSDIENIQAGDQISEIRIQVQRWKVNP